MDVRAADTSNLAAKRLELEKVRPVAHKQQPQNMADEQLAAEAAAEANGNVNRPRMTRDRKDERSGEAQSRSSDKDETGSYSEDDTDNNEPDTDHGEHHILDVKV